MLFDARPRRAFTLIELLVVIAIIALLVAILLPALGKARLIAKMTKDTAAIKQLHMSWANYATDNKDVFVPGYKHWNWAHTHDNRGGLELLNREGALMAGTNMKPWPNQLWSYQSWDPRALITEDRRVEEYLNRPKFTNPGNAPDVSVASNLYEAALNFSPSFAMNTCWVGGNFLTGAFHDFWGAPGRPYATSSTNNNPGWKKRPYVQRSSEVRAASKLMVFTTARGADISTGQLVAGHFQVDSPSGPRTWAGQASGSTGYYDAPAGNWTTWTTKPQFNPARPPTDYGSVDCRYFGSKAISAFIDGHAETLGIESYYNMEMWSNFADKPDWNWSTERVKYAR